MIEIVGKAAFDKGSPKARETCLMETAMRIQEVFDDMWYTQHVNPDITDYYGSCERYTLFCDWAREYEDKYFGTEEYDTDWAESVREFAEAKIKEVFG